VIRDPDEYEKRGPGLVLTAEDQAFMIDLLRMEPGLFLDEMRERLYNQTDTLLSISSLHSMLVEHLEITLKKANTINIKKSLVSKYSYVQKIATIPAEFLVFSGKYLSLSINSFLSQLVLADALGSNCNGISCIYRRIKCLLKGLIANILSII
jgi:hypothetical protein